MSDITWRPPTYGRDDSSTHLLAIEFTYSSLGEERVGRVVRQGVWDKHQQCWIDASERPIRGVYAVADSLDAPEPGEVEE